MRESEIQEKMQHISELHQNFLRKNYELSTLDINSTVNLIEQLYTQLITTSSVTSKKKKNSFNSPNVPLAEDKAITKSDEINLEIDEVFNPPIVNKTKVEFNKANKDFQLGINEKILFAKELFDDDVTSLNEKINQLKSFENSNLATSFFDQKLAPFLIDEGKDEEIIQDFRSIIQRIYG